jgi:hypothetical protein
MKPSALLSLTASLALAFFFTSDTRALAQAQIAVPSVQEEVIVTTPPPLVKGSTRDHFLTFDAPVAIPGVTLSPGAYIFRRMSDMNVVQILSADRHHVYAMYNMWPAYRAKVTDRDAILFGESAPGAPKPILSWFRSDESLGYSFPWVGMKGRISTTRAQVVAPLQGRAAD